jgi:signal peptidase I
MTTSTAIAPARIESDLAGSYQQGSRANPIAEKIRANGSVCFRVLGASMYPWIRSGDFVFVKRSAFDSARVGEVVLFEREKRLFVHRIVGRAIEQSADECGSFLITKGDALDGKDAPVSAEEFLGRVTRIHRGERHIDLEFLGRIVLGRLLAFVSPASFLVYRPLRLLKHRHFS